MKANELMIGDWVICHHPTCEPKQIQVNAGLINGLERQDLGFQTEESPLFRIVEPIPLTDEILRESGFAQHHSYEDGITFEKFVTDGMRIDQLAKDLFVWICPGTDAGILTLHYVHELQHALKLCGIDKNIGL